LYQPKSIYVKVALDAIIHYLKNGNIRELEKKEVPEELTTEASCFVSIHKTDGSLRGCIGTVEPHRENLYKEIIHNAVSAATRDPRFEPLSENELEDIEISVDVLSKPVTIKSFEELDPKHFGLIVRDRMFGNSALLLPDIKGINTVDEQVRNIKLKAGIYKDNNEGLEFLKFTSERFH